jgi:hypothetical protein
MYAFDVLLVAVILERLLVVVVVRVDGSSGTISVWLMHAAHQTPNIQELA